MSAERGFELVSRVKDDPHYRLPRRMTKHSAAYDFFSPITRIIAPGESIRIPTGIKVYMGEDEVFYFFTRSGWGTKYGIVLRNNVAVLDSDYYDNPDNEGEVYITLCNTGEESFQIQRGDRYCQGVFQKFLTAGPEFDEGHERKGGLGSTGR